MCDRPLDDSPDLDPSTKARLEKLVGRASELKVLTAKEEQRVRQESEKRAAFAAKIATAEERLEGMADVPKLQDAERHRDEVQRQLCNADKALTAATDALQRCEKDRDGMASAVNSLDLKHAGVVAALENLATQINQSEVTLEAAYPEGLPRDITKDLNARAAKLEAATEAVQKAREALTGAQDESDATLNAYQQLQDVRRDMDSILARARESLDAARDGLAKLKARVAKRRAKPKTLAGTLKALRTYRESLATTAAETLTQQQERTERTTTDLVAVATGAGIDGTDRDPKGILDAIDAAYEQAVRAEEKAAAALDELKRLVMRRAELEQEIDEQSKELALYRFLAQHLRADRFINFMIGEGTRHLAAAATQELEKISRGRYSLRARDNLFSVVDHHNADEQRSVDTLSGGESFLASLSLALALSRGILELTGDATRVRLDAIFIDEGFGTLDPETLDVVIDSLEQLQQDERMVGVITHVPTLAERLPRVVRIESKETGTGIRVD